MIDAVACGFLLKNSNFDEVEKAIADAILDRLIHQSNRIELRGESMRRKRKKED